MRKIVLILILVLFAFVMTGCNQSSESDDNNVDQLPESDDNNVDQLPEQKKTYLYVSKSWFDNNAQAYLNFPVGMIEGKTSVSYTVSFAINTSYYSLTDSDTTNMTLSGYTKCTYWGTYGTGYTKNINFTIYLYKNNNYSNTNLLNSLNNLTNLLNNDIIGYLLDPLFESLLETVMEKRLYQCTKNYQ